MYVCVVVCLCKKIDRYNYKMNYQSRQYMMSQQQPPQASQTQMLPSSYDQSAFLNDIKSWVEHNSRVELLNQKLKEEKKEIEQLTPRITVYMENNGMQNTDINLPDSTIKYDVSTNTPAMTLTFLRDNLLEYFNGDANRATDCLNFLKNKRVAKTSVNLKRTYK